eukprot:TRINITY_DN57812_c0_g1_i1.p1 TRINITY_DN57812_c0_g1~~TRINITY_DN57812_c0_g1_i1.p1  ORF type:complete len:769 (+),score=172.69 TRINITY_DN57812_c0_g1_i1:95-2401(+)
MSGLSASAAAFQMPGHQASANFMSTGEFDNQNACYDSSCYAGAYGQLETPQYDYSYQCQQAGQWQAPEYSHGYHQAGQLHAPQYSKDFHQVQTAFYTECSQQSGYSHSTNSGYWRSTKQQATTVINLDDFSDISDSDDEQPAGKKLAGKLTPVPFAQNVAAPSSEPDSEPFAEPSPSAPRAEDPCFKVAVVSGHREDDVDQFQDAVEEQEDEEEEEMAFSTTRSEPESEAEGCRSPDEMTLQELLRWRKASDAIVEPALYALEKTIESEEIAETEQEKTTKAWQSKSSKEATAQSKKRQEAAATPKSKSDEAVSWRSGKTNEKPKLDVSDSSWLADQQRRRGQRSGVSAASEDERVARSVKSILNKLTLEKFESLFHQLLDCGISKASHVELLIHEIFEKATLQHNFIEMYADLCMLLHEHFIAKPYASPDSDPSNRKNSFKKLLLDECQASFERTLVAPAPVGEAGSEEQCLADARYKAQLLGNIKLVGALLSRGMLAGKVAIAIMEELLSKPTPEALESLAALLTAIGASFDRPDWQYKAMLDHVFQRVKALAGGQSCPPRERCLLKDMLDLRSRSWKDIRPKRVECPMTLNQVAQQQAGKTVDRSKPTTLLGIRGSTNCVPSVKPERDCQPFRQDVFRSEARKALLELRASGQSEEALTRLAAFETPTLEGQAEVLCELLVDVVQEGSKEVRKQGFEVIVKLVKSSWSVDALGRAIGLFLSEQAPDLVCDVPTLPKILGELHCQLSALKGISLKDLDAMLRFSTA